jgi:hypothetical protein
MLQCYITMVRERERENGDDVRKILMEEFFYVLGLHSYVILTFS